MTLQVSSAIRDLFEDVVALEASVSGFAPDVIFAGGMRPEIVEARGRAFWRGYHQLGLSTGQMGSIAGVPRHSVARAINRINKRIAAGEITDLPAK